MSLVQDALRGARYSPKPGERIVNTRRAVKAEARSVASAVLATNPREKVANGSVDLSLVAAQANLAFAPRTTLTPDDIAAALLEQGISFQPPLGPGTPLNPYDGYGNRVRTNNYTPGSNISSQTRENRMPFGTLTAIVMGYDIAQICISHTIADLTSMPLLFRAIDGYEGDVSKEIAQAKQFWKKPDGKHPWRVWLTKLLYQQLAYDCAMVYKVKTASGKLEKVQVPDGRMFAPVIDYWGERPDAPAPSIIQFVEGIPWGWQDETMVIYEPFTARAEDPRYGLAPIECVLLNANTDVRFQWHFLQMFTGGQVPEGFAEAPPDQSDPDSLEIWQELWDNFMYGDMQARYGVRWLPSGSKFTPYKPTQFDAKFPEYLMRRTVAMFHRTPQDLGILDDVNRATSETQVDQQFRINTRPRAGFIEDIFLNPILQEDLQLPIEAYFDTGEEKEDRLMVAQEQKIWIDAGVISSDEPRERILGLPVDPDNRMPRSYNAGGRAGVIPNAILMAWAKASGGWDLTTGAPFIDKVVPKEWLAPGELAPPPTAVVPGQKPPPAIGPGGTAPAGPKPASPPPTSTSTSPKEPAHDETNVESASGQAKPPTTGASKAAAKVGAAGLVVHAIDTGRVLMMQRSDDSENEPSMWEFPGGTNDDIDHPEKPEETARREWAEEIGVPVPAGKITSNWKSPDGKYQGFVLDIEHEADLNLRPKKIDKDEVQQVQWISPENARSLPDLRPELKETWPPKLGDAEKDLGGVGATTAGINSATGLNGAVLTGFDDDEEDEDDPEVVKKILDQWESNAMIAVRRGRPPRYFADPELPVDLARNVFKALKGVRTRADVRAVFKAAKTDPKALRWQGHRLRSEFPKVYGPKISAAMTEGTKGIAAAVALVLSQASKETPTDDQRQAARAAAEANVEIDPTRIAQVLGQMYADAYIAGSRVARDAVGVDAKVPMWLPDDALTAVSRDWDDWQPGWGEAALKDADGGLATLLDDRDITIKGLTSSAIDRVGDALADGITAGDPPATIAKSMSDIIADPARGFMIADTETARSMTAASIDTYKENEVDLVDMLVFDPCPECEEIADDNPYPVDAAPDVPIHPNCRCALAPAGIPGT